MWSSGTQAMNDRFFGNPVRVVVGTTSSFRKGYLLHEAVSN